MATETLFVNAHRTFSTTLGDILHDHLPGSSPPTIAVQSSGCLLRSVNAKLPVVSPNAPQKFCNGLLLFSVELQGQGGDQKSLCACPRTIRKRSQVDKVSASVHEHCIAAAPLRVAIPVTVLAFGPARPRCMSMSILRLFRVESLGKRPTHFIFTCKAKLPRASSR